MDKLFCDLKTDEEKAAFFLSGRGYETGVISQAIQNDVAMAYHRCAEYQKELKALQSQDREDAERYRRLRKGNIDDVAVVRGLGAMDYGASAVIATYSEELDGDDLDAAIDHVRRIEGGWGMTVAEQILESLVNALDSAFISTWQSTAHWQKELDEAREYLEQIKERK